MSKEFKSEEAIVDKWKEFGDLQKHPLSSETFAFYDLVDNYGSEDIIGFFKDTKDNWHTLNFGQWINVHNSNDYSNECDLDANQICECILELQRDGHIMDNEEGRIYYVKDGKIEDTGYKRNRSGSHLDSAYLFKDSFVIDNKVDNVGDPDHDVYGSENITKNKLYKRQEDGTYKQIWESRDCIFQRGCFPDNVYFSGGSWRYPEVKDCFVDGQFDDAMKQKIDIALKLEKLRHTKDPLQEKQREIERAVQRANRGRPGTKSTIQVGKTGSRTGEVSSEHVKTAKVQAEVAKEFMKRLSKQK